MSDRIKLPCDGRSWWENLGIKIKPTDEELKHNMAPGSNVEKFCASEEATDARRLIEIGTRTGDDEMVKIGRQRMRMAMGKTE